MKAITNKMIKYLTSGQYIRLILTILFVFAYTGLAFAQDEQKEEKDKRPVRPMFESIWIFNEQTVIVPTTKTFEWDIQHNFGTVDNGASDLWGIYAPGANIRLGFSYTPVNNFTIGVGTEKANKVQDLNWKYSILRQTRSGSMPIALTYFGNVAIEAKSSENYENDEDRLSYLHQLILARKFSAKFSLQVAFSFSHFNAVDSARNHDQFQTILSGRYKFSPQSSIIVSWAQPLISNDNPEFDAVPGFSIGYEVSTSSHAFQIFFSNYDQIIPQYNYVYNQNKWGESKFLLGFVITRLWNF